MYTVLSLANIKVGWKLHTHSLNSVQNGRRVWWDLKLYNFCMIVSLYRTPSKRAPLPVKQSRDSVVCSLPDSDYHPHPRIYAYKLQRVKGTARAWLWFIYNKSPNLWGISKRGKHIIITSLPVLNLKKAWRQLFVGLSSSLYKAIVKSLRRVWICDRTQEGSVIPSSPL